MGGLGSGVIGERGSHGSLVEDRGCLICGWSCGPGGRFANFTVPNLSV